MTSVTDVDDLVTGLEIALTTETMVTGDLVEGQGHPGGEGNILKLFCMSLCMRKPTIWVRTRSDTNWALQSQKMARSLKFWI